MTSNAEGQCTALNVSDAKRCDETSTSPNGLFCAFHSRQCQALYRGYKRRNADLDRLSASPPQALADPETPLANQHFTHVGSEQTCREIHDYLFRNLQLLQRVIRARELHHTRFFSMNYDYGHSKYLDQLKSQRAAVTRALERIERRTAGILYKNQKWFNWVRQCQDEDEAHREKEQKRVKQEAALFRRHWKEVQRRLREKRAKEDQKKQDAYLEKVYKERLAKQEEGDLDDSDWDPIEDVIEDHRGDFVDLIKHFLWVIGPEDLEEKEVNCIDNETEAKVDISREGDDREDIDNKKDPNCSSSIEDKPSISEGIEVAEGRVSEQDEDTKSVSSKKSKNSKKKKKKTPNQSPTILPPTQVPSNPNITVTSMGNKVPSPSKSSNVSTSMKKDKGQALHKEPDKSLIETREEVYDRLKNGQEYNLDEIVGVRVGGTVENPVIATKTITFADDEIQRLLAEISEIKHLLFCRLLLGHAALLPAALRANSVEEFLSDPEATESALRDLCLKMERPGLQEIRDACADLFRSKDKEGEYETSNSEEDSDNDTNSPSFDIMILKPEKPKGALPEKWKSKREKAKAKFAGMPTQESVLGEDEGTAVDFGEIKDGKLRKKMIRVKICGRTLWNYPQNGAMSRKGWLHFCIIAKDCSLYDAIELCRHWDEFFELNILAIWHYFPGANWTGWVGNRWRQQMLELGFIVYFETAEPDAYALTQHHQSGRHGQFRRSHNVLEARNFICAHIKRDDPVSRRLIQYLSMQSNQLLVLVRDAETGRILVKPPEDQRWLLREKSGLGRVTKGHWNVIRSIGPLFFEEMDRYRKWNFGFKEYYDVYVWDLQVGEVFPVLYNSVQQMLFKAHRCRTGADLYNPAASVLKTLTKDIRTHRPRDIKPGEDGVNSIYDDIHHEGTQFFFGRIESLKGHDFEKSISEANKFPRSLLYNEADALEDEILFPEERSPEKGQSSAIGGFEQPRHWEEEGFSLRKFMEGWDSESDYESDPDSEDVGEGEAVKGDEDENDENSGKENCQVPDTAGGVLESSKGLPDSLRELLDELLLENVKHPPEKSKLDIEKEELMNFLDREKARTFKEVWHKADLEPQAQTHYIEMMAMAKRSLRFNERNPEGFTSPVTLSLMKWLSATGDDVRDVRKAVAKVSPFFNREFLDSKDGEEFCASLLFKQEERAKQLPDIRSAFSNTSRKKEFWKGWEQVKKDIKDLDDIPEEWDVAIRPIIARLYKAGVIRNRADEYFSGQAIAAKEPHRATLDLFFDWRHVIPDITLPRTMENPSSIPAFRTTAKHFSTKHPDARFAILRLWSAPHFYPLMIGFDNQDPTSFQDLTGRTFVWMFVPKDMPYSEWSMHHMASQRISPTFRSLFGDKVIVKTNVFLVMGEDEKELMKLAMAITYAIERKPWRWEVDLWKSFVNIDFGFLERLQDEWLE